MNIVLALSILLASGFAMSRVAKLVHLPAVTGYIIAGTLLGPSGLNLIGTELSANRLEVFTNIALMLVAFGIGERFDLQQLRFSARALVRISAGECGATFVLVAVSVSGVAWLTGAAGQPSDAGWYIALGLVAASVAVATAPATTVAVLREIGASGPVSRNVLSCVVVNNALSVTLFGLAVAVARVLLNTEASLGIYQAIDPIVRTVASLVLGIFIGFLTDILVHRLTRREEVLIVSLAAVFSCGGLAHLLGLSALMAGVAAGFAVVNRDRRDVRAFRALNDFEPPLFGIFFALAGAQLQLSEMLSAGAVGAAFVVARAVGKYAGAWWGGYSAGLDSLKRSSIGLGLLPQAGLAIALAYLARQDASIEPIQAVLLNAVIASVVVNEIVGPPLVRLMASRAGELELPLPRKDQSAESQESLVEVVPWKSEQLQPSRHPDGYVMFGVSHPGTVVAVTRIATLLSHHYQSHPMAVHVATGEGGDDFWGSLQDMKGRGLFKLARREAEKLGYKKVRADSEFAEETAEGILRAAESANVQAIVLGHPFARRAPTFSRIVDAVAHDSPCPVIVAKLTGSLKMERILVPLSQLDEITALQPLVEAMGGFPGHVVTFLQLMPHEVLDRELYQSAEELKRVYRPRNIRLVSRAVATESRVHTIIEEAQSHDLVIMTSNDHRGMRRVFFGSLAEDVALRIDRPMLLVRG